MLERKREGKSRTKERRYRKKDRLLESTWKKEEREREINDVEKKQKWGENMLKKSEVTIFIFSLLNVFRKDELRENNKQRFAKKRKLLSV